MVSVEQARSRILSYVSVLNAEETPILETISQVLAEDLNSEFNVPPMDNSAMDGFAVLASDTVGANPNKPVELPVARKIAAGELPGAQIECGTAIRIMTGAPLPPGATAVVAFEDTDEMDRRLRGLDPSRIGVRLEVNTGENTRKAGEDVAAGSLVLKAGTVMRPPEIAVVASLGKSKVSVIRRPEVGIIATGDELQEPGEDYVAGRIYNSNTYGVAAQVAQHGGVARIIGIARDTVESLERILDLASSSDMVVTSAGVSKGDYDVVKEVLARRGEIAVCSVRMRPAKPLAFGVLTGTNGRSVPLLGLPGNPVSAMVAFEQFGRPAIRLMMGKPILAKPTVQARLDDVIYNHDGRRVYARVVVYQDGDTYRARLTGSQSSGVLTSMAAANGLAICPDDRAYIPIGDVVTVEMLDWPDEVF